MRGVFLVFSFPGEFRDRLPVPAEAIVITAAGVNPGRNPGERLLTPIEWNGKMVDDIPVYHENAGKVQSPALSRR
jgi:hypothetical protein